MDCTQNFTLNALSWVLHTATSNLEETAVGNVSTLIWLDEQTYIHKLGYVVSGPRNSGDILSGRQAFLCVASETWEGCRKVSSLPCYLREIYTPRSYPPKTWPMPGHTSDYRQHREHTAVSAFKQVMQLTLG